MERVDPVRPKKKNNDDPTILDPFQNEGPASNVFNVKIDFLGSRTKGTPNRNTCVSFPDNILVAEYEFNETCEHGNRYEEKENTRLSCFNVKTKFL